LFETDDEDNRYFVSGTTVKCRMVQKPD